MTSSAIITSPIGNLRISGSATGVCGIAPALPTEFSSAVIPDVLELAVDQLSAYFSGVLQQFTFPLDAKGTPFQQNVWRELMRIPFGQTISYARLASAINQPSAVRAVASANAKNPLLIAVPCHRVIGSNGKLTGFSAGIDKKQWLLNHERQEQNLFSDVKIPA